MHLDPRGASPPQPATAVTSGQQDTLLDLPSKMHKPVANKIKDLLIHSWVLHPTFPPAGTKPLCLFLGHKEGKGTVWDQKKSISKWSECRRVRSEQNMANT